jgi:hypothetical protein
MAIMLLFLATASMHFNAMLHAMQVSIAGLVCG